MKKKNLVIMSWILIISIFILIGIIIYLTVAK